VPGACVPAHGECGYGCCDIGCQRLGADGGYLVRIFHADGLRVLNIGVGPAVGAGVCALVVHIPIKHIADASAVCADGVVAVINARAHARFGACAGAAHNSHDSPAVHGGERFIRQGVFLRVFHIGHGVAHLGGCARGARGAGGHAEAFFHIAIKRGRACEGAVAIGQYNRAVPGPAAQRARVGARAVATHQACDRGRDVRGQHFGCDARNFVGIRQGRTVHGRGKLRGAVEVHFLLGRGIGRDRHGSVHVSVNGNAEIAGHGRAGDIGVPSVEGACNDGETRGRIG